MKKTIIKHLLYTVPVFVILSSITFAQCQPGDESPKKVVKHMACCKGMNHSGMEMKKDSTNSNDKTIIDVDKFDTNKDGKVYQDQMDWDVIQDTPGNCSKCGMRLKEVSVKVAKQNLVENGFKIQ